MSKFNLSQYVQDHITEVPGLNFDNPQQYFKDYLKNKIETDYTFAQELSYTYDNFDEIVEQVNANIINLPLKEFYDQAIYNKKLVQWLNSTNIEDQVLYWTHYLKTNAQDNFTMRNLYFTRREMMIEDLDPDNAGGYIDQIYVNALIDGLDKAALMLGLNTGESSSKSDPVEESSEEDSESSEEDSSSTEEQEILEETPVEEDAEPEYLRIPVTDADGNVREETYKLLHQFTRIDEETGIAYLLSDETYQNWQNCTLNPNATFFVDTPGVKPEDVELNKDIFSEIISIVTSKFTEDLKEHCELVIEGIGLKSDNKWNYEKL